MKSIKLVSEKFDGSEYNDWKRSMLISLSAKNKVGFVDGSISRPGQTSGFTRPGIDQNLAKSVLYFNTTREIWVSLEERFGASSGTVLYALQQSRDHIEQDPLPTCSCANCTCSITQKLLKPQQDSRLIVFSMKLNGGYKVMRGSLLLQQPLPTIEEKHKQLNKSSLDSEFMAFAVNKRSYNKIYNNFEKNIQQNFNGNFGNKRQNSYNHPNRKSQLLL
ncbi:uncharacterized protein LOC110682571 [Chenopodium quinoa]|uniref:uncharacterized protein LOC110682571 n=1 Tax=Chenopodium quinoa TaxID=63459 RepID=UPI000B7772F8|nr:uncharacterized protein LOC110682571 [Chenopodium quinoa]